jgi:hypothetical protein
MVKHAEIMLSKGLVQNDNGATIREQSQEWQDYMAMEEYKLSKKDFDLFDYLFEELTTLEDQDSRPENKRWTKYFDEDDKRVFYKKEGDSEIMTVLTDCVMNSKVTEALCTYDNA